MKNNFRTGQTGSGVSVQSVESFSFSFGQLQLRVQLLGCQKYASVKGWGGSNRRA